MHRTRRVENPVSLAISTLVSQILISFVSCKRAELISKLICNPVWRCNDSPGTQGLKDHFLTPHYIVDYNRRLRFNPTRYDFNV